MSERKSVSKTIKFTPSDISSIELMCTNESGEQMISFAEFVREMALGGSVRITDQRLIKDIKKYISSISNNVNQSAKSMNIVRKNLVSVQSQLVEISATDSTLRQIDERHFRNKIVSLDNNYEKALSDLSDIASFCRTLQTLLNNK